MKKTSSLVFTLSEIIFSFAVRREAVTRAALIGPLLLPQGIYPLH
jgi:hypothetical protein